MKVTQKNYYIIQGWMLTELNLKGSDLLIYAIIYGFSQDGESCFNGSRQYLCDFTGATKPTIDKALSNLIDYGYILKNSKVINGITFNEYKANLDILDFTSGKETLLGSKEILLGGGKETLPNNKENINKNISNSLKKDIYISKERFSKPSLIEVENYINDKGYHFSADDFIDHYETVGWKVGKSPMKDWRACCRTWESNYMKNPKNKKEIEKNILGVDIEEMKRQGWIK